MRRKGERNGKYKEEIESVRKSVISEKENKNGKRKMKEKEIKEGKKNKKKAKERE